MTDETKDTEELEPVKVYITGTAYATSSDGVGDEERPAQGQHDDEPEKEE